MTSDDDATAPLRRAQILRIVAVLIGFAALVGLMVGRVTRLRVDVAGAIVVALLVAFFARAVVAAKRRALPPAHVLGAAGRRGLRRRQLALTLAYARIGAFVAGFAGVFIGAALAGRHLRMVAHDEAQARGADEAAPPPCPSCEAHRLADDYAAGLRRHIAERERRRATMTPTEFQAYEQAGLDEIRQRLDEIRQKHPNASTSTVADEATR